MGLKHDDTNFRLNYPLNASNGSVYALTGHHPECHRHIFPLVCENVSSPYKIKLSGVSRIDSVFSDVRIELGCQSMTGSEQ